LPGDDAEVRAMTSDKDNQANLIFSPIDKADSEFDPDLSACGLTPEMLKKANQLYQMTFVTKNPMDKLVAQIFYKDVDFENMPTDCPHDGSIK
jgi:hypothetical protein